MPERLIAMPEQLKMIRPHLEGLPELEIPELCVLRAYQPGDDEHWVRIMNDSIGSGWTAEKFRAEMISRPEFRAGAIFIAVLRGVPQGTAAAWPTLRPPDESEGAEGYVHMVGVSPEARGHGLGWLVTLATLRWFQERGFARVFLTTDDWRLPAISIYLKLGFQPVIPNEEHAERWAAVRRELAKRAGR